MEKIMKKLSFILGMCLIPVFGFSQTLTKHIDDMSGKVYFFDSGTYYIDSENEKGYRLDGNWDVKDGQPVFRGFFVKVAGIGGCVENVDMIILFQNGDKITKRSFNKFNCDGLCFYAFSNSEIVMLQTLPIDKVRFTNGRGFESVTGQPIDPNFFIEINKKANNLDYSTSKE
jgi:hypothetical protein